MTERKSADQYENDVRRLDERTKLILSSLHNAPDVDQETWADAAFHFGMAFALLYRAIDA